MAPTTKKGGGDDEEITQQIVATNYSKMCRSIGVQSNSAIADILRGTDDESGPLTQLLLNEDIGKLGAGGVRALACAFLGVGPNFSCGPYKLLQSIRIWKCFVGDDGLSAIAELLVKGAEHIPISYLELMDCKIGLEGCQALGEALDGKNKSSLLTLKMNYNPEMGDEGVTSLCRGLFTNQTLKQLYLDYCSFGVDGARSLGQLLSMPKSALTVLSIQGNSIGMGLKYIAKGVKRSVGLTTLNLSDNAITGSQDREALNEFHDAIVSCSTLSNVDFTYNPLDRPSAEILLPALELAENIKTFLVDATLDPDLFAKLNRIDGGGTAGKKKKGKKKK